LIISELQARKSYQFSQMEVQLGKRAIKETRKLEEPVLIVPQQT
jgi:hypothetical protein